MVPRRLLTEAEYEIEGKVVTENSLNELREYCLSPQCNAWQLVERLSDPKG